MAATSLWHIRGSLKDLIDYVENPEKVTEKGELNDFFQVFSYIEKPEKTKGEYISAVNCLKETALQQMIMTKKQYGKEDKYIAWHGYQSFKSGEVTAEKCHQIGVELAERMWGDRFQIIVTTHLDKDHLHNHFCFNSVSFIDGKKYNYSKQEQRRLRDESDALCREHGLSVIEKPRKAPSRPIYLDEKSGKPTRYQIYLEDLTEAMQGSRTLEYMKKYLLRKGYEIDFTGKHWKMKLPRHKNFTRLDTLDERFTPEFILSHLGERTRYGNRPAIITSSPYMPQRYKDAWKPKQKTTGILALYYYWCYQLGVLPKKSGYKPTSPFMKEELRKLDEITMQVRYMEENNITTLPELEQDMEKNQAEMDRLISYRTHLQNKIRRATPEEKAILREEKTEITAQIAEYRRKIKCARGIEKRSADIDDRMNALYENELKARENHRRKEDKAHVR